MEKNSSYQIGMVAKETAMSIDTIRYYEKFGLVEKPPRSEGGFRKYSPNTIEKLGFIKKAQSLGFTLNEIKNVMQCSKKGLRPCCDFLKDLLEKKLDVFEIKIKELQRMRKNLKGLLSEWIPLREAKKCSYTVCPQIEKTPKKKRGTK